MGMFDHKEYVYAVYQEKSFSAAAKKLFVTQPCLSAMVKKVEDELGVQIFNRKVKPLGLTEYGEQYIRSVEQVLQLEQDFDKYLTDVRGLKTGRVAVGANSICASYVLPDIIREFMRLYPQIDIAVHEGTIEYLEENLASGRLDLVLDNYEVNVRTHTVIPLIRESLYVAVPKAQQRAVPARYRAEALTARDVIDGNIHTKALPFKAFEKVPFLTLRKGHDTRQRFEDLCHESGVYPEIVLKLDQLLTAFAACSDGIGATIVSNTLIRQNPVSENLLYYQVKSEHVKRDLFFHYPKNRHERVAVLEFMYKAQEIMGKYSVAK